MKKTKSLKDIYFSYTPLLILALALGGGAAVLNGLISLEIMDITDLALAGKREEVLDSGKYLVLLSLIFLLLSTLLTFSKGFYRRSVNIALKKQYIKGVFGKNINEFNKESNSRYISGMTNDLNTIDVEFIDAVFELVLALISFVVAVVIIASVNIVVLAAIGILGGVVGGISVFVSRPLKKMMTERSDLYKGYTGYLTEVLNAFRIIKSNNLCDRVKKNFHDHGKKLQDKTYDIDRYSTFIFAVQNGTMNFLVLAVLTLSVYLVITGSLTFGGIVLVMVNMNMLIGPFRRAGEFLPKIIGSKVLFDSLDATLKNSEELDEDIQYAGLKEKISFRDVSFAYDKENVLKNVELDILKGEKILIIGPSGGGKSTLMRMLRKYHHPTEGKIFVDGSDLSRITRDSYFQGIANVDQNIFIFDDTLRNNLTLYRETGEKRILDALKMAGLEKYAAALPDGLDTVLKDNGSNISGGERSRIAIARAILEDIDVLFLDEAFASLDYSTAAEIERTILTRDALTVINVSHLIINENLNFYDKIFYVSDGKVIQRADI